MGASIIHVVLFLDGRETPDVNLFQRAVPIVPLSLDPHATRRRRSPVPIRLAAALVASTPLAWPVHAPAQERPFGIVARQSVTYDSNVLRLPSGVESSSASGPASRGDWISTTSIRAEYGNLFGTQAVRLFSEVNAIRFRNLEGRDAIGYGLGASWNGELGPAWFVAADASSTRFLTAIFNQVGTERNLRTINALGVTVGRRLTPSWSLVGRADVTDNENSAADFRFADRRLRGLEAGVRYQPLSGIDASVVFRRTDGSPLANQTALPGGPLGQPLGLSFTQDQLLARGRYVVTGKSSFDGDIGLTRLRFDDPRLAGFSGVLFGLTYNYSLSDALSWSVLLRRDLTGSTLAFAVPVDQWAATLGATWRLTGRTSLGASLELRRLDFFAEPLGSAITSAGRTDDLRSGGITVSYELLRSVFLTGSLQRVERRSSLAGLDAKATIAAVTAEWRYR